MSDTAVRGRFIWHEIMTTDTEAAATFYTRVVGWWTQTWPQDPSYTMFVAKGGPMAGLMLLPEDVKAMGAPPNWMTYIGTPDVDETSRLAADTGGRILKEPTSIPNVGRFAVIQDPQGAVFAAFTPVQGPMGEGKPTLGDFSWHELATTDWQAAFAFYGRLFGWEKTESMDMGPKMGTYQMFGWKGRTLGGMFNKPKSMLAPSHWLPYAMVPDSKKAAELVRKLGGQILSGPMEVPGGDWVAQCMDPQGAVFAVHSLKPAAEKAAKKPAAKKATKKAAPKQAAKKPAAKKPARKPARKPAAKKAAKKAALEKAAKKPAAKKAARKPAAKKPAGKRAKPKAARKRVSARPRRKAKSARKSKAPRAARRLKARPKGGAKKRRR